MDRVVGELVIDILAFTAAILDEASGLPEVGAGWEEIRDSSHAEDFLGFRRRSELFCWSKKEEAECASHRPKRRRFFTIDGMAELG